MTRKEEIAAANPYGRNSQVAFGKMIGFQLGAEWADAHPFNPTINNETNMVDAPSCITDVSEAEKIQYYQFIEAPDGIYIATKEGRCWKEEYFSECKEETVGIAIFKGDHRIVVSKFGSDKRLSLHGKDRMSSLKICYTYRECIKDFSGDANTEALLALGSPAAEFCKEQGEQWYIPAAGELNLMDEYGDDLDRMLSLIGGFPLPKAYHWSSTQYSETCFLNLDWDNGFWFFSFQLDANWVRPVSTISLKSL